ncbi:hypothetical protein Zmor_018201 [Zophobas morio]|uniref:DUF4371 domain-containing protein n=1 Tax=Zophobas morio TaxID=2755281 RepID=A0AA38IB49_9CUCU|nr:hypothetical protein Zmor_018201 [Zophobas morio]
MDRFLIKKNPQTPVSDKEENEQKAKEEAFTKKGFKNWKNPSTKNKGIPKHVVSDIPRSATKMWVERQRRDATNRSVSTLLNDDVLKMRRYYVKSIAEIIQFLAVNEVALRGTYSLEENEVIGLFNNLFSFMLKKDEQPADAYKIMPQNANYRSPEIQNEIIQILADMVKEQNVNDIKSADVSWHTILVDGTKDKNRRENVALAIRYVKNGQVAESILCIKTCDKFDTATFTDIILNELNENGLSTKNIPSQCYDGASVVSGKEGDVQASVQKKKINRKVSYVHCANHRLHLVVVKALDSEDLVQRFFQQCASLYCFFSHSKVHSLYHGQNLLGYYLKGGMDIRK